MKLRLALIIPCLALGLASREAVALPVCEEGKADVDAGAERERAPPPATLDDTILDDKILDDKLLDDKILDDKILDDKILDDKILDDTILDDKHAARVILPCVLAEMGSTCADATFYVVTPQGLLLCQIDVPALSHQALPEVERPPASPPATSAFFAAAVPAEAVRVPAALVVELPGVVMDDNGEVADGFSRLGCPPS